MPDLPALRDDVATANVILERMGLSRAFGHASARIPGTNTFLLPTRRSPGLAQADNLLVIDTEGRILEGEGEPNSEFWIHARIYAARADVGGVVHAHPDACVCLTQVGEPHRVVHNQGAIFSEGVPEYSAIGLIRSRELGENLARVLGRGNAVMMRAHGITTAFDDVRTATVAACYLEESASMQLRMLAAAGGDASRLRALTREEALPLHDQIGASVARRAWEYFASVAASLALGEGSGFR
ncbi:MAG TPA: class II aldolase/adducin family protein [Usitatibacter sp.]|nr:class II aldolase/adducin family protein [Usitatibacter sp.]